MSEFTFKSIAHQTEWGRGRIYGDITELIGNTPTVKVNKTAADHGAKADVLLKLEWFNPANSVKDRIGVAMIDHLEAIGKITPQTHLVEPTSGNTGVGLAFVAAARGYKLTLVMPETMSLERRKLFALYGAEMVLTEGPMGMKGAIAKADEMVAADPNAIQPSQFANPANPAIHEQTTALEILRDTGGELGALVLGVGTGGTITGTARVLKDNIPGLKVVAVEPTDSPVLSGGNPGPHKIQGIGAGFKPDVLDMDLVDEVVTVGNEEAFDIARELAAKDGIMGGISTGGNIAGALQIAKRDAFAGKRVLTVSASNAERYYSSLLFEGLNV